MKRLTTWEVGESPLPFCDPACLSLFSLFGLLQAEGPSLAKVGLPVFLLVCTLAIIECPRNPELSLPYCFNCGKVCWAG